MTDWTTARVTPEMLAELRRLAEAATPGPWEAFGAVGGRGERWLGVTTDMRATEAARAGDVFAAQGCTRQDVLFIAAANPAVVLALLDERDALAAAWDEGHQAGHKDARAVQSTYPEPTPNPYRAEGEPHA